MLIRRKVEIGEGEAIKDSFCYVDKEFNNFSVDDADEYETSFVNEYKKGGVIAVVIAGEDEFDIPTIEENDPEFLSLIDEYNTTRQETKQQNLKQASINEMQNLVTIDEDKDDNLSQSQESVANEENGQNSSNHHEYQRNSNNDHNVYEIGQNLFISSNDYSLGYGDGHLDPYQNQAPTSPMNLAIEEQKNENSTSLSMQHLVQQPNLGLNIDGSLMQRGVNASQDKVENSSQAISSQVPGYGQSNSNLSKFTSLFQDEGGQINLQDDKFEVKSDIDQEEVKKMDSDGIYQNPQNTIIGNNQLAQEEIIDPYSFEANVKMNNQSPAQTQVVIVKKQGGQQKTYFSPPPILDYPEEMKEDSYQQSPPQENESYHSPKDSQQNSNSKSISKKGPKSSHELEHADCIAENSKIVTDCLSLIVQKNKNLDFDVRKISDEDLKQTIKRTNSIALGDNNHLIDFDQFEQNGRGYMTMKYQRLPCLLCKRYNKNLQNLDQIDWENEDPSKACICDNGIMTEQQQYKIQMNHQAQLEQIVDNAVQNNNELIFIAQIGENSKLEYRVEKKGIQQVQVNIENEDEDFIQHNLMNGSRSQSNSIDYGPNVMPFNDVNCSQQTEIYRVGSFQTQSITSIRRLSSHTNPLNSIQSLNSFKKKQQHVHEGFCCMHCTEKIYGVRYECSECLNQSICEQCEDNNSHPEKHVLLKFKFPLLPVHQSSVIPEEEHSRLEEEKNKSHDEEDNEEQCVFDHYNFQVHSEYQNNTEKTAQQIIFQNIAESKEEHSNQTSSPQQNNNQASGVQQIADMNEMIEDDYIEEMELDIPLSKGNSANFKFDTNFSGKSNKSQNRQRYTPQNADVDHEAYNQEESDEGQQQSLHQILQISDFSLNPQQIHQDTIPNIKAIIDQNIGEEIVEDEKWQEISQPDQIEDQYSEQTDDSSYYDDLIGIIENHEQKSKELLEKYRLNIPADSNSFFDVFQETDAEIAQEDADSKEKFNLLVSQEQDREMADKLVALSKFTGQYNHNLFKELLIATNGNLEDIAENYL
ncbi:ef hand domain containing protein [Stylonychia lemnae]|uniref:Ef hand domain containing protein n=1 Tax=Stylonychia lemnae TaxID=5949 RepID=A0A078BAA2_STYLE|nr:ef hand domain containing protein [Stylonychia lemnae]|eukprot:CDW90197.1 ef hand domain containing protein [Stylonychia lemnae]